MKFPSVVVVSIIVGVVALLQHLLGHVKEFGLPELYEPVITVVLTTIVRIVQELNPPQAAARGMGEEPSFLARVIYK